MNEYQKNLSGELEKQIKETTKIVENDESLDGLYEIERINFNNQLIIMKTLQEILYNQEKLK